MLCLKLLEKRFHINNIRVGGPCDQGVDLVGKWISSANLFVQCKHINKKVQPVTVRELEGVLMKLQSRESMDGKSLDHLGLLASSTEWTFQSINRLQSSPLPLMGMVVDVEKESISNLFINHKLQSLSDLVYFEAGKSLDGNDLVIKLLPHHQRFLNHKK